MRESQTQSPGSDPFQESINQTGIAEDTLVPDPVLLITQAKTGRLIKKLAIKYGSLVVCLKVLKDLINPAFTSSGASD